MGDDQSKTLAAVRPQLHQRVATPFVLVVTEGPDRGKRFEIDPSHPTTILIGKSEACDVQIQDAGVSRRHASIEVTDRHLLLTDLRSTNGTEVDGIAALQVLLRGGEVLRLSKTLIAVERLEPKQATSFSEATSFGRTLGGSVAMRRLHPLCERLAATNIPLVIEGETGTGKELLAESIHECGPRAKGPFAVFDCTAVAPNLIESELFGHTAGAFTGAQQARPGVFERAHGGTLLIDEIGDLPLNLQPKLLRVVERSKVTRVGGGDAKTVDVRLISATRRSLDHLVQAGRFRDDLFHRIAVARIELPPLRRRTGDVTLLARHFWEDLGGTPAQFPADVLQAWEEDDWPGNVRQLRNTVTRVLALGDLAQEHWATTDSSTRSNVVTQSSQGDWLRAIITRDLTIADARNEVLNVFEQRYVEHLQGKFGDDTVRASAAAGVARRSLQRLYARFKSGQS